MIPVIINDSLVRLNEKELSKLAKLRVETQKVEADLVRFEEYNEYCEYLVENKGTSLTGLPEFHSVPL